MAEDPFRGNRSEGLEFDFVPQVISLWLMLMLDVVVFAEVVVLISIRPTSAVLYVSGAVRFGETIFTNE